MSFRKRAQVLFALLVLWAILLSARLYFFTVHARDRYLAMGNLLAWRRGTVPPKRGRIISADGKILAWSKREYELYALLPEHDSDMPVKALSCLRREFPKAKPVTGKNGEIVVTGLEVTDLARARKIVSGSPLFRIRTLISRKTVKDPEIGRLIGETEFRNGMLVGISGLEKKYDHILRGTPGSYRVMLARDGSWITGTWDEDKKVSSGKDVVLAQTTEKP